MEINDLSNGQQFHPRFGESELKKWKYTQPRPATHQPHTFSDGWERPENDKDEPNCYMAQSPPKLRNGEWMEHKDVKKRL